MSTRRATKAITRQDGENLRKILLWLEQQPEPDPLELDVLTAIVERVERFAHAGAIVRIRAKNLGTPPSEKQRAILGRARAKKFGYAAPEWTPDADARLRFVWGETATPALEIAEEFGRSPIAIRERASLLGVRRNALLDPRVHPRITPLGRARLVIARRRAAEALRQREEAFGD
jgi:hypothetical protein